MDNFKEDKYYIEKAIENISAIIQYTSNTTYDEFMSDKMLIDAVMFRLVQMAENLSHVSLEYKHKHPSIKWGINFRF